MNFTESVKIIKHPPFMLKIVPLLFLVGIYPPSFAQSIVGFWEVTEVTVGSEIKTPVAKWTKVNADGTYQAGNGWLQNSEGTWLYDKQARSYSSSEANGLVDNYGAFKVSFKDSAMIWERQEDGLQVTVKLERIKKLPKSTADFLVGIWNLKEVLRSGQSEKSIFDPQRKHYIFIRWDRIYVERTPEGDKATGYWHINGHRPEITFLSHSERNKSESWSIVVDENELRMTGLSDSTKDLVLEYTRVHDFPD
jgi:hypothetical protein